MKLIGCTTIGMAVLACLVALCCCYQEPVCVPSRPSVTVTPRVTPSYQDACVTVTTHPELKVELERTEKQAPNCPLCYYYFRVWNQTAAVGTKAYKTQIMVLKAPEEPIVLNGKTIQKLRLHGFVTDLPPIFYPVLRYEEYFVVEGMCPECLPPGQHYLTLIIEYYECDGIRRFKAVCDLRCQEVKVVGGSFEPMGRDCCE